MQSTYKQLSVLSALTVLAWLCCPQAHAEGAASSPPETGGRATHGVAPTSGTAPTVDKPGSARSATGIPPSGSARSATGTARFQRAPVSTAQFKGHAGSVRSLSLRGNTPRPTESDLMPPVAPQLDLGNNEPKPAPQFTVYPQQTPFRSPFRQPYDRYATTDNDTVLRASATEFGAFRQVPAPFINPLQAQADYSQAQNYQAQAQNNQFQGQVDQQQPNQFQGQANQQQPMNPLARSIGRTGVQMGVGTVMSAGGAALGPRGSVILNSLHCPICRLLSF